MLTRVPDYFERFSCLAGACPHSCCIGWEVVIDPATARTLPRPAGRLSGEPSAGGPPGPMRTGSGLLPAPGRAVPLPGRRGLCARSTGRLGEAATSSHLPEPPPVHRGVRPLPGDQPGGLLPGGLRRCCWADRAPLAFRETEPPGGAGGGGSVAGAAAGGAGSGCSACSGGPVAGPSGAGWGTGWPWPLAAQEPAGRRSGRRSCRPWPPGVGARRRRPAGQRRAPGCSRRSLELLGELEVLEPAWRELLAAAAGSAAAGAGRMRRCWSGSAAYFLFRYGLKAVNDGDLARPGRFLRAGGADGGAPGPRLRAAGGGAGAGSAGRSSTISGTTWTALQDRVLGGWPRLAPGRFRSELRPVTERICAVCPAFPLGPLLVENRKKCIKPELTFAGKCCTL